LGVDDWKAQHPFAPILYADDAPDLVAFIMPLNVLQGRSVEIGQTVFDEYVAVRHEPMDH
jgi:hypothetical protein